MTMIAACRFESGVVLMADSRATWAQSVHRDSLQKVLHLDRSIAASFCGDVFAAAFVVNEIRKRIAQRQRLRFIRRLAGDVPRLARHAYDLYRARFAKPGDVELLLVGINDAGGVDIHHFVSPRFDKRTVESSFIVRGSGAVVHDYLHAAIEDIRKGRTLRECADALLIGLEGELQRTGIPSVGGLFQVLLVEQTGIRGLRYGFMSLDPDGPPVAKEIELKLGTWTQRDTVSGKEIVLKEPAAFFEIPAAALRIHDFEPATAPPAWHLVYFATGVGYEKRVGFASFEGLATRFATQYPATIRLTIALALWGSPGNYSIELRLITRDGTDVIDRRHIVVTAQFIEIAGAVEVSFPIRTPGAAYLECWIDGRQRIARRALLFGDLLDQPTGETDDAYTTRQTDALRHAVFEDPEIVESHRIIVERFALCSEIQRTSRSLSLLGIPAALYAREYPVPVRLCLAIALRGPRGQHPIEVQLVNAATRATERILSSTVGLDASGVVNEIDAYLEFVIPVAGVYFVNLLVDGDRVASAIFPAERPEGAWSFSLRPEDAARLQPGEFSILLRGSSNLDESQTR